ncbi:MAG TPA: GNAT family N-acetyltransferase [Dehalococcoidia bacterium]|jgi:GNAT superfamily N-acetyltransferase
MQVRQAVMDEVKAIAEMSRRVQERLTASGSLQQFGPIPPEVVAAYVAGGSAHVLADEDGIGPLLGSVFVEPEWAPVSPEIGRIFADLHLPPACAPRWWLQKLMIEPARQGGRLGHELLDGVKRHVAAQGGGTVLLDCWAGNAKLRAFYLEDGFHFHGEFREEGRYEVAAFTWTASSPARR